MKLTALFLLFFLSLSATHAQTITYDDFKSLIPSLQEENWKTSFKQSSKLLKSAEKDTSEFKAIVLYINLFSAAGMVTKGEMSYAELEKNVMKFKGQKIIMAAHPVTLKDGGLRQLKFDVSDSTNQAFTSATNSNGTNILCFEKFFFKDKINLDDFPEKSIVRCGGTLDKIETNPNQSKIWILRLTVKDAFARRAD